MTIPGLRLRRQACGSRRAAVVAVIAVAALGASGCTASKNAVDPIPGTQYRFTDATPKGEVIPEADRKKPGQVSGELLDGSGTYTLSADSGKVVMVNLWAAWCGPCKVETPQYQQAYLATEADGVQFVGFDVKDDQAKAKVFVEDNQVTYPIVYDQPAKVALQLGNLPVGAGLPLTVLVDKQGRVAAAYVGIVQPSELKPAIATLVAES